MRIDKIYEVKNDLESGTHSQSQIVEHRFSGETLILKRVECDDEQHANKAFDEYVQLKNFHHEMMTDIKSVFIHWDPNLTTFYIYVVKEYVKMPSLATVISKFQGTEIIPLAMIELVLISALRLLNDMKESGLMHRAIHPANIFTDGTTVRINDAGVPSIISYLWSSSKKNVDESFEWLPTEAKECGHMPDVSDSWSLGCVILKMMYCGSYDESEGAEAMEDIRSTGEISHEMEEVLKRNYPKELIELVKQMIVLDVKERIGITEAFQSDFIQHLLEKYDAQRKLRRKRQEKQVCECPIPFEHGLSAVLRYLGDELENENCVQAAFSWIASTHCKNGASTDPLLPLHVWRVFLVHQENPSIVQSGFEILAHCTSVGEMRLQASRPISVEEGNADHTSPQFYDTLIDNSTCWNEKSLQLVNDLAKRHMEDVGVHEMVLVLLEAIFCPLSVNDLTQEAQLAYWSSHGPSMREVCKMDFPDIITKALMRVHDGYARILRIALAVMWKLCIDHNNVKNFVSRDAFRLVYEAMFFFPKHPGIIDQGALCLAALASHKSISEATLEKYDILRLLLDSIYAFCDYTDICYNLFYAVMMILNRSAEQILRFVRPPNMKINERGILALIFKAYSTHRDNDRILVLLVNILEVVMANDGILEAIVDDLPALKKLLREISNRFPNLEKLGGVAEGTLSRIPEAFNTEEESENSNDQAGVEGSIVNGMATLAT